MLFCAFWGVQPKHQNGNIFVDIERFRPCLSKPSYRAPKWALMVRLMQKERLKSPQKLLIIENQGFGVILRRRQPASLVNGELSLSACRIRRLWDGMVLVTKQKEKYTKEACHCDCLSFDKLVKNWKLKSGARWVSFHRLPSPLRGQRLAVAARGFDVGRPSAARGWPSAAPGPLLDRRAAPAARGGCRSR